MILFDGREKGISHNATFTIVDTYGTYIDIYVNAFGHFFNSVNPASTIYINMNLYQHECIDDVLTSSFIARFVIRLSPDAFNKNMYIKYATLVLVHCKKNFQEQIYFKKLKKKLDLKIMGIKNIYRNNIFIINCLSYIYVKKDLQV